MTRKESLEALRLIVADMLEKKARRVDYSPTVEELVLLGNLIKEGLKDT